MIAAGLPVDPTQYPASSIPKGQRPVNVPQFHKPDGSCQRSHAFSKKPAFYIVMAIHPEETAAPKHAP